MGYHTDTSATIALMVDYSQKDIWESHKSEEFINKAFLAAELEKKIRNTIHESLLYLS